MHAIQKAQNAQKTIDLYIKLINIIADEVGEEKMEEFFNEAGF